MVIQDGRLVMFGPRDEVLRKIAPTPPPSTRVVSQVKASS
jgi:ABC-type protease/lipase transport system fused ATPase/permease subunit